ncbi:unnamed protein product [Spirodela intermedia]|uniref:Uncharacterized protein n=1 Tax=Spirodela intermedia TaxID=51605 RepID=A0A7I8KP66_SPIIN|nr:unnamed protein product [Spirodela intermedia]
MLPRIFMTVETSPAFANARHGILDLKNLANSGLYERVLFIFFLMRRSGVQPDHRTFPEINRARQSILCVKMGLGLNLYFRNTMIEVYARHGRVGPARLLFDEMPVRDVVSWTSLISGLSRSGKAFDSLILFQEMLMAGFRPNSVTMLVLLRACSVADHILLVKQLHGFSIKGGLFNTESVQNSVMAAFGRIGLLEEVERVFNTVGERSLLSWNTMISGYSSAGDAPKVAEAADLFREMQISGADILGSILHVCSNVGSLRSEVLGVIRGRKVAEVDGRIWGSLLSSCRTRRAANLAAYSAQKVLELEPDNAGYEGAFCNVYVAAGSCRRTCCFGIKTESSI